MEGLVQQLMGGNTQSMNPADLHGTVGQLLEQAPNEHGIGAITSALESLGGGGFGQSVQQAAAHAGPTERNGLADTFLRAISQGGGSPSGVLSQLGIGGGSLGPQELGMLGQYVAGNHSGELAGLLGNQLGSGGHGGLLQVLGNPMVREIGMHLAHRLA
jgi:hypothetical protein